MIRSDEILKACKLSSTGSRKMLLEILNRADIPLSEKEIEKKMNGYCNRTTIYRNLSLLASKGILQRILSGECIKYKLIARHEKDRQKEDHVHFQCRECNTLICLEDLRVKDYILPEGYSRLENQFLIVGICKNCNENEEGTGNYL